MKDETIYFEPGAAARLGGYAWEETAGTLRAGQDSGDCMPTIVSVESNQSDARMKIRDDGTVQTLLGRMGTGGNNIPLVGESWDGSQTAPTLTVNNANGAQRMPDKDNFNAVLAVDGYNQSAGDVTKSLTSIRSDSDHVPIAAGRYIVRRLTPGECESLQGFPKLKKWDVEAMTKDEYIAWNLAEGNIIADAEHGIVYGTRGPGGVPYDKPKELKGSEVNGYKVVSIRNGATKLQCRVHRIIWISQHGVLPEGYVIDHINNDKHDNRISNLQLLTPSENSTKACEDGLYKYGLENKATKLDPDLKDEIAFLYHYTDITYRKLAEIYGISKSRIGQIIKEVGWTDIGEWVDSKGKKRQTTDSARYKALGNSIAVGYANEQRGFWMWLMKRISAQYERRATLGSLFDGISGFPLAWAAYNGADSCLWSSEIEDFCIAVAKKHFGDEDTEGDIAQYLYSAK